MLVILDFIRFLRSLYRVINSKFRFIHFSLKTKNLSYIFDRQTLTITKINTTTQVDYHTIEQIFTLEEYRLDKLKRFNEIQRFYLHYKDLNMEPLIIDCGANIGAATLYFNLFYSHAKVVAIEPSTQNFRTLRENCAHNSKNILINAGIGSECGSSQIVNADADNNAVQLTTDCSEGNIKLIDVQSVFDENSDNPPFIVKIDIEGFESELFSKNTDWVEKVPVIIMEPHDWLMPKMRSSCNFINVLNRSNRDFIIQGENIISISNVIFDEVAKCK